jgi:hypothetical protein
MFPIFTTYENSPVLLSGNHPLRFAFPMFLFCAVTTHTLSQRSDLGLCGFDRKDHNCIEVGQFFHGRAWVKKDGLFWYIDPRGKRAIKKKFAKASDFGAEFPFANVVSKNLKDTLRINIHGKPGYKTLWWGKDTYQHDYFDIRKIAVGDPRDFNDNMEFYGRIDDSVQLFKCQKFRGFYAGDGQKVEHAVVTIAGHVGVINEDGAFILKPVYDTVLPREDLYFKVQRDGKWAYFDSAGKKVTGFEFDRLGSFWAETNGHTKVRDYSIVKKNEKVGLIGADGKLRTEIKFDSIAYFREGISLAFLKGKPGYINTRGKEFFED